MPYCRLELGIRTGNRPHRSDEPPSVGAFGIQVGIANIGRGGAITFVENGLAFFEQYPPVGLANRDAGYIREGGRCSKCLRDIFRRAESQGQATLRGKIPGDAQAVIELAGIELAAALPRSDQGGQ